MCGRARPDPLERGQHLLEAAVLSHSEDLRNCELQIEEPGNNTASPSRAFLLLLISLSLIRKLPLQRYDDFFFNGNKNSKRLKYLRIIKLNIIHIGRIVFFFLIYETRRMFVSSAVLYRGFRYHRWCWNPPSVISPNMRGPAFISSAIPYILSRSTLLCTRSYSLSYMGRATLRSFSTRD